MRRMLLTGSFAGLCLLGATLGLGQTPGGGPGGGGRGGGGGQGQARLYNTATVETVSGEVVSVEQVANGRGGGVGLHAVLKTVKGDIAVHLGPLRYLQSQGLDVRPKDQLEVRGSRVTYDGKPAILAAEVKTGDKSVKLRDDNGMPLWRGRGPGRGAP